MNIEDLTHAHETAPHLGADDNLAGESDANIDQMQVTKLVDDNVMLRKKSVEHAVK
jgi:hypothetical protein